jgi:hypothetical protein
MNEKLRTDILDLTVPYPPNVRRQRRNLFGEALSRIGSISNKSTNPIHTGSSIEEEGINSLSPKPANNPRYPEELP